LKRIYLILLTAATLAAGVFSEAQAAQAAPGAELKIGFIDADRINRESVPAERATKKLEKEFAPREQELRRIEGQIKSLQGQLEKDGLTMSDSDRRTKETELGRQTREYQRLQRISRRPEPAPQRRARRSVRAREPRHQAGRRKREVRFDRAGSGIPQPAHRHHRESTEGPRVREIAGR